MLETLGTIFGAIFSGGATGIIGVVAQRFADYKNKQLDMQLEAQRHANAVALKEVDLKYMQAESEAKLKVVNVETQGAVDVATISKEAQESAADAAAFAASFKMEPQVYHGAQLTPGQNWLMVVLDVFRGSVRPALTLYLCVLTTMIYFQAKGLLAEEDLDVKQAMDLTDYIVHSILYLFTTVTLWYFGTRNKGK